jgi:hypothetical protein
MGLLWHIILLVIIGLVGSVITKQISIGNFKIYWATIPSILSGLLWGSVSKTGHNLNYLSALFDVVYASSFVVGFVLMGEPISLIQAIGFSISILGICLMTI